MGNSKAGVGGDPAAAQHSAGSDVELPVCLSTSTLRNYKGPAKEEEEKEEEEEEALL